MNRWPLYLIAVPLGLGILGAVVYLAGVNVSIHVADMWGKDDQPTTTPRELNAIA
ncbi:MAG: hypothetical protein L0H94_00505 [Nitrospira sp.]|nr:hypothetical protein [Nitrospira sp.]